MSPAITKIMIPGAPDQARWVRAEPRRSLPVPVLDRILHPALPHCRVLEALPLADGRRNSNFELRLDSPPWRAVLRIYEHDPSLCQKEVDLFRLVSGSVPVPEVIHVAPRGDEGVPPFTVMRFIEGIGFRELKRSGDTRAIAQAARSAGETLAVIGRFAFSAPGWLAPGPSVSAPLLEGADPLPRFVDACLASPSLLARVPPDLRDRTAALVWAWGPQLALLAGESHLVHGDFNRRNLLVRETAGRWSVAAVLDWEFAVSGSPMGDLGQFLRYERASRPLAEPHFSAAFRDAGGALPPDWRRLARLLDLAALCESLTHLDLPDTVTVELVELVRATVEDREPTI